MDQDQDEIVVFRQFDNAIDASLAKSKLDAYGIPCFLTEENMASLYPGQQALPFRVRLHIFSKDTDEVSGILLGKEWRDESGDLNCPRCRSGKVERDFPKEFSFKPLLALALLFFGVFFPHRKVNHCLNCDHEF